MITISPSQEKTALDCPRKWGLSRLDRIREPRAKRFNDDGVELPNKADFGNAVHKELEDWAEGRNEFSPNEAGAAGSKLSKIAMPPGVGVAEGRFKMVIGHLEDGTPVAISGIADRRCGPGEWDDNPVAIADDYKTTGDYKYALTKEGMISNGQVLSYVVYVATKYKVRRVLARWLYVRLDWKRDGSLPAAKSVRKVERLIDLDDPVFQDEWEKFKEHIMSMARIVHSNAKAGQMKQNPLNCNKYGGCGYKGAQCKIDGGDTIAAYIEEFDRMKALDTKDGLITLSRKKEDAMSAMDLVNAFAAAQKKEPEPSTDCSGVITSSEAKAQQEKLASMSVQDLINTPATAPKEEPKKEADTVTATVVGTPGAATAALEKAEQAQMQVAPQVQKAMAEGVSGEALAYNFSSGGHLLYVDCAPVKGAVATNISDILKPLKEKLKGDAPHWTMAGNAGEYIERKGKLLAMLEHLLTTSSATAITVDSQTDDGRLALDTLISNCSMVVKG